MIMGTSSIFDGPVSPQLPNDDPESYDPLENQKPEESLEETDSNQEEPLRTSFRWKDAKTVMTRYVKGSSTDCGKVLGGYVKASGGSKELAKSSVSGKSTMISLGGIIQDFRNQGVENTLELLQIDCVGKGVKEVLSRLVNAISGSSDSKEDIVARGAVNEAISVLYTMVMENDGDIESLQRIDEDKFRVVLETYMSEYIFSRMLGDLQSRFEKYGDKPKEAVKKERELKDYIRAIVEIRLKKIKPESMDYHSISISKEIENLFINCFRAFEKYI